MPRIWLLIPISDSIGCDFSGLIANHLRLLRIWTYFATLSLLLNLEIQPHYCVILIISCLGYTAIDMKADLLHTSEMQGVSLTTEQVIGLPKGGK